ncbi:hypothetical protein CDAR_433651 [Caerostris darwini]|uniref:Uncharacterized protein n=1 Tax=Caerostris darwini TaxID=1538125 RepID=A0AAV4PLY9_9ARAC|nr:hypothetical protein CDAR_433651 [Caerostris darwini]
MRVDDDQRHFFQYLDHIADRMDAHIKKLMNKFNLMQQSVLDENLIDLKNLTIYGCIATVPVTTNVLNRLRAFRARSENLQELYKTLEDEAQKYQHPTLLDRLDTDMKLKIIILLDKQFQNDGNVVKKAEQGLKRMKTASEDRYLAISDSPNRKLTTT